MNPISTISPTTLREELKEYFGVARGSTWSPYHSKHDYRPGVLSEAQPSQLHETAHHSGGSYVHLENGSPAMKSSVIAMLEAHVPYSTMRGAMEYLKGREWDKWRVLDALTHRPPRKKAAQIAEEIGICEDWLNKQKNSAILIIADYLTWHYNQDQGVVETVA